MRQSVEQVGAADQRCDGEERDQFLGCEEQWDVWDGGDDGDGEEVELVAGVGLLVFGL